MHLYLVRHGIAEDREEFKKLDLDDRLRPLTNKGRKKLRKIAIEMKEHVERLDWIVTSPLSRARQTAETFAEIYTDTPIVEATELSPETSPSAFFNWLRENAKHRKKIMAIGHEPHLGLLASWLLTQKNERFISFKKGGVACLFLPRALGHGPREIELEWLLPPRWIID